MSMALLLKFIFPHFLSEQRANDRYQVVIFLKTLPCSLVRLTLTLLHNLLGTETFAELLEAHG
jgi:hypothetical protein